MNGHIIFKGRNRFRNLFESVKYNLQKTFSQHELLQGRCGQLVGRRQGAASYTWYDERRMLFTYNDGLKGRFEACRRVNDCLGMRPGGGKALDSRALSRKSQYQRY